jgi:hypothetical protein
MTMEPTLHATDEGSPQAVNMRRAAGADILARHAKNPAQQRAVDALRTANLRLDDLAALDELSDTESLSAPERRLIAAVRKMEFVGPIRPPEPPLDPEYERTLSEAFVRAAEARVLERHMWDERLIALAGVRTAKGELQLAKRTAVLKDAEVEHLAAEESWLRAARQVQRLQRAEQNRRLAAAITRAP